MVRSGGNLPKLTALGQVAAVIDGFEGIRGPLDVPSTHFRLTSLTPPVRNVRNHADRSCL
jgi:hypothetical protein